MKQIVAERWADLLTDVVRGMVENKAVKVTAIEPAVPGGVTILSINVAPDEIGRVIGKVGSRINALNVIAQGWAGIEHLTVRVEVEGRYERIPGGVGPR
jgi:predicted RNA-binding protein YlqC (UPF0109 family)